MRKRIFRECTDFCFAIDANTVIWNNGTDEIEIDLEKIVRQTGSQQDGTGKRRPVNCNPALQLSGIYFMQELRRPVETGGTQELSGHWKKS